MREKERVKEEKGSIVTSCLLVAHVGSCSSRDLRGSKKLINFLGAQKIVKIYSYTQNFEGVKLTWNFDQH